MQEDDLNIGGDIFTDLDEDMENSQIMEDERYYRYGRFFSFGISLGITEFNGNRGRAYENAHPSYGIATHYFLDFQNSFGLGMAFSKHHMFIGEPVRGFVDDYPDAIDRGPGFIDVNMLRVFFGYRYYVDTADLATAITWSNPYFTMRMEYWYQTVKYTDQKIIPDQSGGAFGFGLGGGFEFPMVIHASYIGVEFLLHSVNYFDKYTQLYQPVEGGKGGYPDLTGYGFTTFASYVLSW